MTKDFAHTLENDPQSIIDALSNPNSYARAQTIAMLQKNGVRDSVFVDAVSKLVDDDGAAPFGMTVGDVAIGYLALSAV